MLLTLMMNLNMFGGDTPPVVPQQPSAMYIDEGGTGNKKIDYGRENREYVEKLLRDDEEVFEIIKIWFKCHE